MGDQQSGINVPSSHGLPVPEVKFNPHCHTCEKMKIRTEEEVENQGCCMHLHSYIWRVTSFSGTKCDISRKHGLSIVPSAIAAAPDIEHKQKSHKETFPTEILGCRTKTIHIPVPYTGERFPYSWATAVLPLVVRIRQLFVCNMLQLTSELRMGLFVSKKALGWH